MAGMVKASAVVSAALFLLCMQLFHFQTTLATTYNVGDTGGWTFKVANWPNGKSFVAGDILVFKYDPAYHNVVIVDKNGYDSCTVPLDAIVYQTGYDQIKLQQGTSYFICGSPVHCSAFMKIAVTAN